jgi:hypothetical protein
VWTVVSKPTHTGVRDHGDMQTTGVTPSCDTSSLPFSTNHIQVLVYRQKEENQQP